MSEATQLRCPACGATLEQDDHFCEGCGARLTEDDGDRSERIELDLAVAAAVSDRGRVHRRNEDAFHLEVSDAGVVAVVCDGISSASSGDVAARRAAKAAGAVLAAALLDQDADPGAATLDAVRAAHGAVGRVPWTARTDRDSPSCTLVCGLYRGGELTTASVGDSRAYWIGAGGCSQLTIDDSWAEEQAAEGLLSFEQVLQDPRSHSITNWIGADAPEGPPQVGTVRPEGAGRLLLCTDGLWNYVPTEAQLSTQIDGLPAGASAAAVARALTDVALLRGGKDNITVVVVDFAHGAP